MIKMTDAGRDTNKFKKTWKCLCWQTWKKTAALGTYDSEDERVGEMSVERELHHVPPQPQQLHRLSQAHKDVTTWSRNINDSLKYNNSWYKRIFTANVSKTLGEPTLVFGCIAQHLVMFSNKQFVQIYQCSSCVTITWMFAKTCTTRACVLSLL